MGRSRLLSLTLKNIWGRNSTRKSTNRSSAKAWSNRLRQMRKSWRWRRKVPHRLCNLLWNLKNNANIFYLKPKNNKPSFNPSFITIFTSFINLSPLTPSKTNFRISVAISPNDFNYNSLFENCTILLPLISLLNFSRIDWAVAGGRVRYNIQNIIIKIVAPWATMSNPHLNLEQ